MKRHTDQGSDQGLLRVVGVPGAVLMGLGSILGTGVFVSIGWLPASPGRRWCSQPLSPQVLPHGPGFRAL